MLRLDAATARMSLLQVRMQGDKIKHETGRPLLLGDLMPYGHAEEPEATLEQLAAAIGGRKLNG